MESRLTNVYSQQGPARSTSRISYIDMVIWIRVDSPRKVSRFAPLNLYYINRWSLFRQCFGNYLFISCMQKNNISFILVYFNYLFISCIQKIIIIHSFWSTFVKALKRNFSCKINQKTHKNSKKVGFFVPTQKCMKWLRCCTSAQITTFFNELRIKC